MQTLVDLGRIRILVVPLGGMSTAKYAAYLALLRQLSAVALSDLSINPNDPLPSMSAA